MIADLERLVGVDTAFPPGAGYAEFAALAEDLTRPLGFEARRIPVPGELWATEDG